jgi:hypothetical protein
MKKIFIIICILITSNLYAIKYVNPGETINNKKVTRKYYILTENEMNIFLNKDEKNKKLEEKLSTLKSKSTFREQYYKDTINLLKNQIQALQAHIKFMESIFTSSEKDLSKSLGERHRSRNDFWKGVGTVLGLVAIFK